MVEKHSKEKGKLLQRLDEKMNAIIRLILFIGIIATLVFNDSRYILFVFIIMIISILIYNYQMEKNKKIEKFLNSNDLDIINNEYCTKPTAENPFMNPNLIDKKRKYKSCSIDNTNVINAINSNLEEKVFKAGRENHNHIVEGFEDYDYETFEDYLKLKENVK